METLGGIIDFITGIFTGDWSLAWQGVQEISPEIWNALTGFLSRMWKTIK